MVVLLDQPLPSNKAAPGAAERRVGPPQTISIHSQVCGSPTLQRDRGERGFTAPTGPVRGGIAALPRNSCSGSLRGTQPPPQGQPGALTPRQPCRTRTAALAGKARLSLQHSPGVQGPPLPSQLQLNPQSSAGAPGGDRRTGQDTHSCSGGISASLVAEGRGRQGQPRDPLALPREPQEQEQPKQ